MSYGKILKTMILKNIIAIALMFFVAYIAANLGFYGIDKDLLDIIICIIAPLAAIIFAVSDVKALLKAARESGGIFTDMSDFAIVSILLLINLVIVIIAAITIFPMFFANEIAYEDSGFLMRIGSLGLIWYAFEIIKYKGT
ncbi:hypothetical protein [Methanobrevibacter sp.]